MEHLDEKVTLNAIAKLCDLRAGETGVVVGVEEGAREGKRLADLGFVHGATVEMLRTGKPCLVKTGGTCVGLGRRLQQAVRIRPMGSAS